MEKDLSQGVGIDVQADASNMIEGEAHVLSISSTVPEGVEAGDVIPAGTRKMMYVLSSQQP